MQPAKVPVKGAHGPLIEHKNVAISNIAGYSDKLVYPCAPQDNRPLEAELIIVRPPAVSHRTLPCQCGQEPEHPRRRPPRRRLAVSPLSRRSSTAPCRL